MPKTVTFAIALVLLLVGAASAERIQLAATNGDVDVLVQESGRTRTVVRFEVGAFDQQAVDINGDTYNLISIDREGILLNAGEPQLPRLSRSLIIPDDANMAIKVVDAKYTDIPNISVAPSKGNLDRTVNPEDIPYTFGPVYGSTDFYPSNLASIREPFIIRDFRGTTIDLNAFQYNPATKTLRVYTSVTVEVYSDGQSQDNVLQRKNSVVKLDPDFDLVYQRRFINYAMAGEKYTSIMESGDMLIITYDAFHSAMQPLVDWKMQKGMKTTIVDVSTIGTTSASIKTYIQNFYNAAENDLTYVLLVGDIAQMPSPTSNGGESDPSYVHLVGTDSYPDAFIGRFSAENVAQVQTQVARTINYECDSVGGDWMHKGTGIGSEEGSTQGHNNEADWQHMNLIRTDLLGFTYTLIDQLYATTGATAAQVSAALNDGRSIVNYCGHGSTDSWGTTGFSNTNVNALTNAGKLPFIISVACVNGDFAGNTCFAEAWLRASQGGQPTGAVATFMSTINQDWVPPMDGQDEVNDLLVAEAKTTFGGICFNGTCKMIELDAGGDGVKNGDTWHVFGDPSVLLHTDMPTDLTVVNNPIILFTDTEYTLEVTGIKGALCALYRNGVLYGSAYTNASGTAVIPISQALPVGEMITLTVTAFNHIPSVTSVQVISPDGPYVVFDSAVVNDASGNANGSVDFGESILLGVQLQNVGPDTAYNVNATISTTDSYVTITDATEAYGSVAPDFGTAYVADGFAFEVSPLIPDKHEIVLALEVTGTARDTWTGTIRLTVHAPALEYVSVTVDDASGNNNGILDPGETGNLVVSLKNSGSGQAYSVAATASESDAWVTLDDESAAYGLIDAGATVDNGGDVFTMTAASDCPMGHAVALSLLVTADGGYQVTVPVSVTVGDRVVFFFDDFAANQGWTGLGSTGEWTMGPCVGGGTTYKDPTEDHTTSTDNRVLGNDLTSAGTYNNNLAATDWVYSPVIDCSDKSSVQMRYWHWLGCESSTYDHAYLEVYNGESWVQLSANAASNQETAWAESYYDLSGYADANPEFRMRWGIGPTDGSGQYSGWNIDDIELKGYSGSGTALLSMVPDELIDTLQPGDQAEHQIRIYNTGTANLGVWFTTDEPWLQFSYDKVTVAPGDSATLTVTIVTTGLVGGNHVGALDFNSNDNNIPTGSVPVLVHVYAPNLSITETELEQRVRPDESEVYLMTLTNSGPGRLLYSVGCMMNPVKGSVSSAAASNEQPLGYRTADPDKSKTQEPYYAAQEKGSGGPDTFGYRWVDSDEPGGPTYSWVDLTTLGTAVTLSDDNFAGPFTIGFSFPFYDTAYTSFYIGSNGYLTFDAGYGIAMNYHLPDDTIPTSMIAMWDDDIDPPEAGRVSYYHDVANGRLIVSFDHVRNYLYPTGTGDLSFQAILYANGRIELQYRGMDPGSDEDGLSGATIGIQNSDASDGLTVVYNAAYMHDNLAIAISSASWLSVTPATGTVEPFSTGTIPVKFDANGLGVGEYGGSLTISSNDADQPTVTLPVTLTVAASCCQKMGNVDLSSDMMITMSDLTILIDHLYITLTPLPCAVEGNLNLSSDELVTMDDLTILIDHLYITLTPLPTCP